MRPSGPSRSEDAGAGWEGGAQSRPRGVPPVLLLGEARRGGQERRGSGTWDCSLDSACCLLGTTQCPPTSVPLSGGRSSSLSVHHHHHHRHLHHLPLLPPCPCFSLLPLLLSSPLFPLHPLPFLPSSTLPLPPTSSGVTSKLLGGTPGSPRLGGTVDIRAEPVCRRLPGWISSTPSPRQTDRQTNTREWPQGSPVWGHPQDPQSPPPPFFLPNCRAPQLRTPHFPAGQRLGPEGPGLQSSFPAPILPGSPTARLRSDISPQEEHVPGVGGPLCTGTKGRLPEVGGLHARPTMADLMSGAAICKMCTEWKGQARRGGTHLSAILALVRGTHLPS